MDRLTRRGFLQAALGMAGGGAVSGALGCEGAEALDRPTASWRARHLRRPVVVVARDPGVSEGWQVDEARLRDLLERAVRALGGVSDGREVWRALYGPEDRVGLKINGLAGIPASTHPEVAYAVADALRSVGLDEERILIWDRTGADLKRAGFDVKGGSRGYACLGTDARGVGYETNHMFYGSVGSRLSRVLTRLTTAQVNLPVLKDHGLAGLSGALKNYYGAIHNPNKYHDNNCDPWVADVNVLPPVREQSHLVVCDALHALCNGGPGFKARWAWDFNGLLVGTDPVAVDRVAWSIIEARRAEMGLKTLEEEGRPPRWLSTASDEDHELGASVLEEIERIDV